MFIELGAEVEMGGKVTEAVAQKVFALFDGFFYEQQGVRHEIGPGGKGASSIDDEVGKGVKLLLAALFDAEGDLIIDVILQLIVIPDGFGDFVAVVGSFLQERSNVVVEVVES